MQLPWVSRKLLEAAEARVAWAEDQLRTAEARAVAADERLADYIEASEARARIEESARKECAEERKMLLDRILQMTGQPALFHPAPAPPAAEPSDMPALETRLSFLDVHRAARKAIADKTINTIARVS